VAQSADDDELISLTHLNCDAESKMLGLWISPSDQNKKMINSLCLVAVNWAAKLRFGRSSQAEAWKALHTTISRKLMYPPPCSDTDRAEGMHFHYGSNNLCGTSKSWHKF